MDNEISIDGYMIERKSNSNSPLDYDNLRALGIKFTQEFSGDTWTDYNLHDPGITILESLCYAITDLAYRTKFNLEDLLTSGDGIIDSAKNYFFSPREVLSTNPVTDKDFRKLVIDYFPEIENVWFEPVIPQNPVTYCKGFYRVIIQFNYLAIPEWTKKNAAIESTERDFLLSGETRKIQQFVNEYRNIGEDFKEFIFLEPVDIVINADIIVAENEMPEKILTAVYAIIYRTLNPQIHFYSEAEMKQMGLTPEQINLGPLLNKGFVADEFLNPRARSLDPLDLVKAIAGIKGVVQVKELSVKIGDKICDRDIYEIDKDQFLFFNYESPAHNIRLYHEDFKIVVKKEQFINKLKIKLDHFTTGKHKRENPRIHNNSKPLTAPGKFRNLESYVSVQQFFPEIYKLKTAIDELEKIKKPGNDAEVGGVKQLKAYLMLFEQVMLNYLAQLSNLDNLFSASIDEKNMHTYFSQAVFNIPGAEKIINDFYDGKTPFSEKAWTAFKNNKDNEYSKFLKRKIEPDAIFLNRKSRLFDHVLSRFNIILNIYPLKLYRELYEKHVIEGRLPKVLLWKKNLLDNIIALLKNRSRGFNYVQPCEGLSTGGFQQLIEQLLYIDADSKTGDKTAGPPNLRRLYPEFKKGATMEFQKINAAEKNAVPPGQDENIGDSPVDGALVFKKMNTRFFRFGIDVDNHKIEYDHDNKVYLLKYKSSSGETWPVVGRFSSFFPALKARNELIDYLRKINTGSEGFHLLEHILLVPPPEINAFGFKILDAEKHLVCVHNEFTDRVLRDQHLDSLIKAAKMYDLNHFISYIENKAKNMCKFPVEHSANPVHILNATMLKFHYKEKHAELQEIYDSVKKSLMQIGDKTKKSSSKIISLIKCNDGKVVTEDFFNFRLTVVLPSWPARFQDINFREYVKKIFIEHSPAHIRLQFVWLDIEDMKYFEEIYFKWLNEINKDKLSWPANEMANLLISWLIAKGLKG